MKNRKQQYEYSYIYDNGTIESSHDLGQTNITDAVEYMTGIWRGRATIEAQSSDFSILSVKTGINDCFTMLCMITEKKER